MISIAMTPERFAAKGAELKECEGLELTGSAGTLSKDGVSARYTYDGKVLVVVILHKPFLDPESLVESKLLRWLSTPPPAPEPNHQVQ